MKLYDYLSLGKPVVSTRIGGAEDLKEVVKLADTPSGFLSEIDCVLQSKNSRQVESRKQVAKANSWPNRIGQVESLIFIGLQRRAMS